MVIHLSQLSLRLVMTVIIGKRVELKSRWRRGREKSSSMWKMMLICRSSVAQWLAWQQWWSFLPAGDDVDETLEWLSFLYLQLLFLPLDRSEVVDQFVLKSDEVLDLAIDVFPQLLFQVSDLLDVAKKLNQADKTCIAIMNPVTAKGAKAKKLSKKLVSWLLVF